MNLTLDPQTAWEPRREEHFCAYRGITPSSPDRMAWPISPTTTRRAFIPFLFGKKKKWGGKKRLGMNLMSFMRCYHVQSKKQGPLVLC